MDKYKVDRQSVDRHRVRQTAEETQSGEEIERETEETTQKVNARRGARGEETKKESDRVGMNRKKIEREKQGEDRETQSGREE